MNEAEGPPDEADPGRPAPPPLGKAVLWSMGVAFVVMQALLITLGFAVLDALTLGLLFVVMPILSVAQLAMIKTMQPGRSEAYRSSIVSLVVLGSIAIVTGVVLRGTESLGLVFLPLPEFVAWSAGLTVALVIAAFLFRAFAQAMSIPETDLVQHLMPRTSAERREFAVVSLAAGYGEEAAYRGYSIPLLAALFGPVGAVAVSSVAFGVMHAYQGGLGMVRTATMGVVLSVGLLASGSVLPGMVAHAAFDLLAGLVLAEHLMVPGGGTRVSDHTTELDSAEGPSWK